MKTIDRFPVESELRSLRNLSWMPKLARSIVLHSMSLTRYEKYYLKIYDDWCRDSDTNDRFYVSEFGFGFTRISVKQYQDDFENCYDSNYNLTTLGQEMHDDAVAMVTQHE